MNAHSLANFYEMLTGNPGLHRTNFPDRYPSLVWEHCSDV